MRYIKYVAKNFLDDFYKNRIKERLQMKIQNINNIGMNNRVYTKTNRTVKITEPKDIFFKGKREQYKEFTSFVNDVKDDINADTVVVKQPSAIYKFLTPKWNTFSLTNSDIGVLRSFDECEHYIGNSKIEKIEPAHTFIIDGDTNIGTIESAHFILTRKYDGPISIGKLSTDYLKMDENYHIGKAEANSVSLYQNGTVDNIIANKLSALNLLGSDINIKLGKVWLIDSDIIVNSNELNKDSMFECEMEDFEKSKENGWAELYGTEVDEITCNSLKAFNCIINKAKVEGECGLGKVTINELEAKDIKFLQQVHIKNLILPDRSYPIPTGENVTIDNVTYKNETVKE